MEKVIITIVITVLNEEKTLLSLFDALEKQTILPAEVIIVDGGSKDKTVQLLHRWKPKFAYRFLQKKGNRSVGRNAGIEAVKTEYIAVTDAGCIPTPNWLEEISRPLRSNTAAVVAGYYKADARTSFQKAASTYMLVLPEKVNPDDFLPATRSMAFTKSAWRRIGRFDERLDHNEDYAFAKKIDATGVKRTFQGSALVLWKPPERWYAFLRQVWRFAYGDWNAGIFRPKVFLIFTRWMVWFVLTAFSPQLGVLGSLLYCAWAWYKNARYISLPDSIVLLPTMQVLTDITVMMGSLQGLVARFAQARLGKWI